MVGRHRAQRRKGVDAASEAGVAFDLAAHEERDEDDARAELRRPGDRSSYVLECGCRHLTVRIRDPAMVVLPEHERVDLQLPASGTRTDGLGSARAQLRPPKRELDAAEAEAICDGEDVAVAVDGCLHQRRLHDRPGWL